jgi:hypothetical protein
MIENDLRATLRNFGLKVGMVRTVKLSSRARSPPTCQVQAPTKYELVINLKTAPRRLAWRCRRRRSAAPTR